MLRGVVLLHRWVGLTLGLLLVVVTLSGAAVVFRPELARLAAAPPSGGARAADLDATAKRLGEGQARPVGVILATGPGAPDAWSVRTRDGGWTAYTDPADGAVLGDTRGAWLPAMVDWLARFHHDLWLRPIGGAIVGAAGLLLVVFCVSGVYLLWPHLRRWTAFRRMDLHRQIGLWTLPALLVAGITGAMFEFTWLRRSLHAALGGGGADLPLPLRSKAEQPRSQPGEGRDAGWSAVAAAAAAAVPDGAVSRLIPPRRDDADGVWRARVRVTGGEATVLLDRRRATVLAVQDPRRMSPGGWLTHEQLAVHTGAWGGNAVRALWLLLGFAPTVLFVTGLAMWRRRHRPGGGAA